ncbi:hypothetical protein [Methylosinus sp. RM1]|uniref:hypothetical protein n=1 Tax=Methylosinus sp. RM1 TaxID=2583817 RepID=UPI0014094021|nr:hypothetical protein [Methylosinus sp. RM1]
MIAAVVGQPPRGTYTKYPRGTTIADAAENAQPGDVVWPALCVVPNAVNMAPLDSAGAALMRGSAITTLAAVAVSSAGGACGENAGV